MTSEDITKPPRFETEREEAEWWDSHQDFILQEFERAAAEGRLGHGTVRRRMEAMEAAKAGNALALDAEDVARANKLAERKGVERQAYLKALLHEALLKEEEAADRTSAA